MAQNELPDLVATNPSGLSQAASLNQLWQTFLTQNSGAARPGYAVPGTVWVQEEAGVYTPFMFNGTDDIRILTERASPGPDFIIENRQASGVGGGLLNAGSTNILTLNTKVRDVPGIVSLASNEFTVTKSCYIEWVFPIYSVDAAVTWLYNVTDSVRVSADQAMGMNVFSREGSENVQTVSSGWGLLEADHTYRIECDTAAGQPTTGQGFAISNGDDERYGYVKGWVS